MRNPTPILLLAVLLGNLPSAALDLPAFLGKKFLEDADKDMVDPMAAESPDNSIDPDRYLIGGGDGFQIGFVGLPSQEYHPVVNQEGDLYIRDFGIISLGKVTLTEAKRKIKAYMEKSMKGRYQAYVTLKRIKKPIVNVGGVVASPGTYGMAGTMRIMDAVKMANRGSLPDLEKVDLRQVELRNGDSVATFDLMRFMAGRGAGQNPYIYPGDQITLHGLDRYVYVKGEVSGPIEGKIPLRPGETLADMLAMLQPKSSMDSSYILVMHAAGAEAEASARRFSWSEAGKVALSDRDVITIGVKENYAEPAVATVAGEAMRPGAYPIVEGVTTAGELLKLAGGARANGNLQRAFILKRSRLLRGGKEDSLEAVPAAIARTPDHIDMALASLRKVRPEMNASLNDMNALRDYNIVELAGKEDKLVLEKDDRIVIPKRSHYVYVSGTVRNPGAYPYKAGKDFDYYVDQAGGYVHKADKANQFLLTPYEDMAKIRGIGVPMEGDVVVVPASIEYKTFTTVWLPVLQILPGVLSLALTIILINQQ